jgi:hypothetical protein
VILGGKPEDGHDAKGRQSGRLGWPLFGTVSQRDVIPGWARAGKWPPPCEASATDRVRVGTVLQLLVRSATIRSRWNFFGGRGVWAGRKEGLEPQRHRGHRVSHRMSLYLSVTYSVPSVSLWFNTFYCLRRPLWMWWQYSTERGCGPSATIRLCAPIQLRLPRRSGWAGGQCLDRGAEQNGSTRGSPMKKPSIWRISSSRTRSSPPRRNDGTRGQPDLVPRGTCSCHLKRISVSESIG